MVPPTESLRFVAGELGKSGRNLEQIGAKFLGPNRFGVFFYLHVHDLGHIGKLEANLYLFKTALRALSTRNRAMMEKSSLFVEVESLCGATGYPLRTPRLEDTVLDAHTREPITIITDYTWVFYASVDGLSLGIIKSWHI